MPKSSAQSTSGPSTEHPLRTLATGLTPARPPATDRGAATRTKLLSAAVELVAERGWAGVTSRAVAERAGVNGALIHYHFGTMDALLIEATTSAFVEAFVDPLGSMAELEDPVEMLRSMLSSLEPMARGPLAVITLEMAIRATRDETMANWMGGLLANTRAAIAAILEESATQGRIAPVDATAMAVVVAAVLDGLLLHRMIDPDLDLSGAVRALDDLLHRYERTP